MPQSPDPAVATPSPVLDVATGLPPVWAASLAVAGIVVAGVLLEFGLLRFLRAIASRTRSSVDDALLQSFAPLARIALILFAVDVLAQLFLVPSWRAVERRVVLTIGVVMVSVQAWRLVNRVTGAWMVSRPNLTALLPSVRLGLQIVLIPVVVVTVLQIFEVPIMPLATTLGIGGLAVSLALQDVLKNVVAGIQIVLDQPIRVGEWVEIDNGRKGTVTSIGLRTTRLLTEENRMIFVPNSIIANQPVVNWNARGRGTME